MKITGSIQARLGSTRLPGKVLHEICGKPMLLHQVERIRRSRLLDDLVVATTVNPNDDPIARMCETHGIKCFRGSEQDVLNRIASLIKEFKVEVHAEFFGDSPLTDAHIVDEVIGSYLKLSDRYDYVSNAVKTTYPPGQEAIVYRGSALLEADAIVPQGDPMREHVSANIIRHPEKFRILSLEAPAHYSYPEIYLEVDTPEDFTVISGIVAGFQAKGQPYFSLAQILDYLRENPEVVNINNKIHRRWKEFRKTT